MSAEEVKTYKQWNAEGRRIHKGSKSVGRSQDGELLFTKLQTYDPDLNRTFARISAHLGITGPWDDPPH